MRFLFTFVGGRGHLDPLVPVAHAVVHAGHRVAFGAPPSMVGAAQSEGFEALPIGDAAARPPERLPLRPVDRDREDRDLRERFVERAARDRVPRIVAACEDWRPDVVVCDETDFGAMVAAEWLGLPHATVLVIASGSFVREEVVGAALTALRTEYGLPLEPGLDMRSRFLVLSPFPPSFRDPLHPLPPTGHAFRLGDAPVWEGDRTHWASIMPGAPAIYFTLGTIFNMESGDLLARGLAGLREMRANLLCTVGAHIDPAEFGEQPEHVRIERFLPQQDVLPQCDLVISHGGSGSVIQALAHGLPSVLIPLGADQPNNADRCAELGVSCVLNAMEATPESIRAAAKRVLADPSYRQSAERMRAEIARLPGTAHAAHLLERLGAEKRPRLSAVQS